MMGFRLLCLIGFIAVVQCDFGHQKGGGSSYGAPPPAPVSSYGAPIASGYGIPPAPVSSGYGVPAPSYGAVPSYEPVHYEKDKPDLKEKLEDFKAKIIGTLGFMKGSILSAQGKYFLKKAQKLQHKGEKLLGIGESLKALKQEKEAAPYHPPPPSPVAYPAAPAYGAAPSY